MHANMLKHQLAVISKSQVGTVVRFIDLPVFLGVELEIHIVVDSIRFAKQVSI